MDQIFFSRNTIIGDAVLHVFTGTAKWRNRMRTLTNIRINSPCSGMFYCSALRIGAKTLIAGSEIDGAFCTHGGMDVDILCGTEEEFGVTLRYSGFVPSGFIPGGCYTVSLVLTLT